MKIIISPAKKMNVDTDTLAPDALPRFLDRAERIRRALCALSYEELKALWRCSDQIARLNYRRLQDMDLHRNLTPAILAYEGIQYRYMAPGVFTQEQFQYLREHLYILSGFYGLLRPFDGVAPYRLEMQAKLRVDGCASLYEFWGGLPAGALAEETGLVVDLASKEYGRCIAEHLPGKVRLLTCTFGELEGDRVVEKGVRCKMARGEMVRFLAEHGIESPEGIKAFDRLGYAFSPERSGGDDYVFLKKV